MPATAVRHALHLVVDLVVDHGLAGPLLLAAYGDRLLA
jgi:hypothetical protein